MMIPSNGNGNGGNGNGNGGNGNGGNGGGISEESLRDWFGKSNQRRKTRLGASCIR